MDIFSEFLHETRDNLTSLDNDMLALERDPKDGVVLARAFRALHTIKGSCGFLKLPRLEKIAHGGEHVMGYFRDGKLPVTRNAVNIILGMTDVMRSITQHLAQTKTEPPGDDTALLQAVDTILSGNLSDTMQETTHVVPITESASIRLSVERLEELMNLMSELILARNDLMQLAEQCNDVRTQQKIQHLNTRVAALQDCILRTRMQPVRSMWQSLPRAVHDIANELNKKIDLVMTGDDTELDRRVLDQLKESFIHLIRNAADHGIENPEQRRQLGKSETGTIRLNAAQQGGQIALTIEDDGRGLDMRAIATKAARQNLSAETEQHLQQLVFAPGFSTRETISDMSGRGVGLDVVQTQIRKIGGTIAIESQENEYCRFTMIVPLTLAIISALLIRVGTQHFALPQDAVTELLRLDRDSPILDCIGTQKILYWRDHPIPLLNLGACLNIACDTQTGMLSVAILRTGPRVFALVVDAITSSEEIIVKALPQSLHRLAIFSGTTLLGNGSVMMIIHPTYLANTIDIPVSQFVSEAA